MRSQRNKVIKTYFLAPGFDYPPGGPLSLGRILTNPFDPGTCINPDGPLPFPGNMPVHRTTKTGWTSERKRRYGGAIGVWAEFLKFLGIEAEASFEGNIEKSNAYKFDLLETEFVEPVMDYIEKSVLDPPVSAHIAETGYRKPIYMITGVKIARGGAATLRRAWEVGGDVRAGVDGLLAGVPVTTGPKLALRRGKVDDISFDGSSDFVFAYRLREIYYERKLKLSAKSYIKGALYDLDAASVDLSVEEPQVQEVTSAEPDLRVGPCADEVETVDSLECEKFEATDEEDDEICVCVRPPTHA